MTFAGRPAVIEFRVAGLRCRHDVDRRAANRAASNPSGDPAVAIGPGDSLHRERLGAKPTPQPVQFVVIARDAEFPLGLAVPGFQLFVAKRPRASDTVEPWQVEIARNEPRTVAAPCPRGTADHPVIAGLEGVLAAIGVVVIGLGPRFLLSQFQLSVFRGGRKFPALQLLVRRIHVAAVTLGVHRVMKLDALTEGGAVIAGLENQYLVVAEFGQLPRAQRSSNTRPNDDHIIFGVHGPPTVCCVVDDAYALLMATPTNNRSAGPKTRSGAP